MRAVECRGQWWNIVEDDRLGHPYPTEFAKHPGLFEGVDLMLLAASTGRALGASALYHLAVLVVLTVNGWIAAYLVFRFTRSILWAALAVTLITVNQPVSERILGHLHLFKFGWFLLAVWAFVAFLERPSRWRAFVLGAAAALMFQASFYLGFLLILGLWCRYLVEILAGRIGREQVVPVALASAVFVVLSGALSFPAWTKTSEIAGSDQFFITIGRKRGHTARSSGNMSFREIRRRGDLRANRARQADADS